jgi:hypothetical protein
MAKENECFLKEYVLNVNDYGTTESISDVLALAREIQTLMLIIPGTYPNHGDLGIGIQTYQFEILDSQTLSEIQRRCNTQISKYIPTSAIQNIRVEKVDNKLTGKNNTIGVLLNLAKPLSGKDSIILTFSDLGKVGKVSSEIYI